MSAGPRRRLDVLLVERGLAESRQKAQGLVMAGRVRVGGVPVSKSGTAVADDTPVELVEAPAHVGRGALKLDGALDDLLVDPAGRVCVDVGASTGGFTEVLLANGAAMVFAIDVGHGQLHHSLHGHPRIVSMEGTDIRKLENTRLPVRPDVVTIDVSFISLKAVLPAALSLAAAPAHLLALIKPQYEAERKSYKGGIIRNAMVHQQVCDDIMAFAASLGCTDMQVFPSSIPGGDGNIEFFLGARRG